ncbi:hypothetical protein FQN54_003032 [Arachnomyces sp. PD_36]|nr:hypothetical protein FQN54_003032 [Arachnomyces sp. PD_36]
MAPPRQQRNNPNNDDSRSEASSTKAGAPKSRRAANPPSGTFGATMTTKEMKVAAATTAVNASAEPEADRSSAGPGIAWSQMPLEMLHDYRHAYNLSTPSAYSTPIASIVLTQGIGLQSPTSIAARRNQASHDPQRKGKDTTSTLRRESTDSRSGKETGRQRSDREKERERSLHRVAAGGGGAQGPPGRVTKDNLALAVRKHFNNVALVEPEAISRFLYKVREEGKGREFRLRFQP